MAQGMVKTSTVTKSRKFLVTVYLFILLMISVVIAILLLLYNEEKSLHNTDIERYAEIQEVLTNRTEESTELAEDILNLQQRLSEPSLEMAVKVVLIDELVVLFEKQIEIANDTIALNDDILELAVEPGQILQAEDSSIAATTAIEEYQKSIGILERESYIISLQEEITASLNCYNSINTKLTSTKLDSAIKNCQKTMDQALAVLNTPTYEFPQTSKYLAEISNYWNITLQLNVAIEKQNESSANKLTTQLESSSKMKLEYEKLSLEELQFYINGAE